MSSGITIESNFDFIKFISGISERLTNLNKSGLWPALYRDIHKRIQQRFDGRAAGGRPAFRKIAPTMYGKIRYSSTETPIGRFSASSRPMHASGLYRRAFRLYAEPLIMSVTNRHPEAIHIPFGGWNEKRRYKHRKFVAKRNPMPDMDSTVMKQMLDSELSIFMDAVVKESLAEGMKNA